MERGRAFYTKRNLEQLSGRMIQQGDSVTAVLVACDGRILSAQQQNPDICRDWLSWYPDEVWDP